jgi:hypothetical protein
MRTVGTYFEAHRHHWWDALLLLPVLGELLLELLQEVDAICMDTPGGATSYGKILDMGVPTLQTGICWTVVRRDTRVQRADSLRFTPKKGQTAWDRRDKPWRRHFRPEGDQNNERTIGTVIDIQRSTLRKTVNTPGEFQYGIGVWVNVERTSPNIIIIIPGES